jgi:hypothetical protein
MFCPNCKAEYRESFTRCVNCDATLVASLATAPAAASASERAQAWSERPALLWTGQDPVTFSVILNALNAAEIPYREWQSRDVTAALSRPLALGFYGIPHWEVRVHPDNVAAACAAVQEALRPQNLIPVEDKFISKEKLASAEPAESNSSNASTASGAQASAKNSGGPVHAPVEIWSGEDAAQAQFFRGSLLENHISCWSLTASLGNARLLVSPDDAARAREIIGEILKNTSAA